MSQYLDSNPTVIDAEHLNQFALRRSPGTVLMTPYENPDAYGYMQEPYRSMIHGHTAALQTANQYTRMGERVPSIEPMRVDYVLACEPSDGFSYLHSLLRTNARRTRR